jgi:hypothetical protein
MKAVYLLAALFFLACHAGSSLADNQACVDCHKKTNPQIVNDWQLSTHSQADDGVTCVTCHGDEHKSAEDASKAKLATPDVCGQCHDDQVSQFKEGKHALAWAAMKAMPATHWQPMELVEGQKGCGACHRHGLKSEEEIKKLKEQEIGGFGIASCDVCHTRHLFSAKEARQPQACRTCHMGMDHPQWEMYESSKHGVRYLLKQNGVLPESVAAPTCQTCHMQDGDHGVRTGWGFLAVRLPMPEDKTWAADRATILQALGVLDPEGNPTGRLDIVKNAKVAYLTQEGWQKERDEMIETCAKCHSRNFAEGELKKGDQMIKNADHLMAEAIRIVAGLYVQGTLQKPESYAYPFPDLLTFAEAPTLIEQKLFIMFLKHRMRTFQGAFHANPDYAFWYGWNQMRIDLTEIKELARGWKAPVKK